MTSKARIRTAVVTGRHPFDVVGFTELFRGIDVADVYPMHLEDFASQPRDVRESFPVVLLYHFHQDTPTGNEPWWEKPIKAAMEDLGRTKQGLFVLHHAIVAWRFWPLWADVVGIPERGSGYAMNQTVRMKIADPAHPITRGMGDFQMTDETYPLNSPGPDSQHLLTTDNPTSMKTIGWTRPYRNSRVFCLQSGHDKVAWANPNFRTILSRGIEWCAGRI
jgi:trehalose utilization protein